MQKIEVYQFAFRIVCWIMCIGGFLTFLQILFRVRKSVDRKILDDLVDIPAGFFALGLALLIMEYFL